MAFYLTCYLSFYLAYLLAFYLAVEVQRGSLSSEGPRLRSSGAQCIQTLAVEVQQCPLRAEVGEDEELARRKWTWKWMQRWWRRRRRRRRRRTSLIKSNNPHLAGGE